MPYNFNNWMKKVDEAVQTEIFVSVYDLPDCNFRDMYESEYLPEEAAREAIENAGFTYVQEYEEFTDADPGL